MRPDTTAAIQFKRATRQAVKLKIGIDGPSGSGKTEGMLALLSGITNGGKIAVADTENESASYFSDRYQFDTVAVPNADADVLIEVIRAAVADGYDALGIDSGSHAWKAILDAKDANTLANPTQNQWAAWGKSEYGPKWDRFIATILKAPIHIVMTMRSKQTYEQVEHAGQKKIVKLGLQPQVREGSEYELGLVFSVNMAHMAEASKDRTHLFPVGTMIDLCDTKVHKALVGWMTSETPALHDDCVVLSELAQDARVNDITRRAVAQLLSAPTPSAAKVAKWTEQLREKLTAPGAASDAGPLAEAATPTSSPVAASSTTSDSSVETSSTSPATPTSPASSSTPSAGHASPTTSSRNNSSTKGSSKTEEVLDDAALVPLEDLEPYALSELLVNLKEKMGHPAMPVVARAYFSGRIRENKVTTATAARVTIRVAALALAVGDELVHADARAGKEVASLLTQPATYNIERLSGILRGLRAQHPIHS